MMKKFIVSGRGIQGPIIEALKKKYSRHLKWGAIDSVYCFAFGYSPLYGGRKYMDRNCLAQKKVERLNSAGIGVELTLSSYYFNEELYKKTLPVLEKLEHKKNGIICTNDEFAKRVRKDFPKLFIRASSIKMIHTHEGIDRAFEIYDSITLPPWIVDLGQTFLQKIREKKRIVIFLTASCAYFCRQPSEKRCYKSFSDYNINFKELEKSLECSLRVNGFRKIPATPIEFDINHPMFSGFTYFKLIQITEPDPYLSVSHHPKFKLSKPQLEKVKRLPVTNK
jgi:hypothetical protein